MEALQQQQQRDENRRAFLKQENIPLVEIDYHWDRKWPTLKQAIVKKIPGTHLTFLIVLKFSLMKVPSHINKGFFQPATEALRREITFSISLALQGD